MKHKRIDENYAAEYNLSVSQFAKLCGTTRDTLRHYYENDILIPRIDDRNGYHYYAPSQVGSFYYIHSFRQAGCSLKEIYALIHDASKEAIKETVNDKFWEMQQEMLRIQNQLNTLKLSLWLLDKYDFETDRNPKLETIDNLSIFKTPVRKKENAHHTGDIGEDLQQHLSTASAGDDLSIFPIGVTMSYDDLTAKKYTYNNIISLNANPADHQRTFPLPSVRIVSCFQDDSEPDITRSYEKIVEYINANGLEVCSDLHIISLINLYESKEQHTYFKFLFICISNELHIPTQARARHL